MHSLLLFVLLLTQWSRTKEELAKAQYVYNILLSSVKGTEEYIQYAIEKHDREAIDNLATFVSLCFSWNLFNISDTPYSLIAMAVLRGLMTLGHCITWECYTSQKFLGSMLSTQPTTIRVTRDSHTMPLLTFSVHVLCKTHLTKTAISTAPDSFLTDY